MLIFSVCVYIHTICFHEDFNKKFYSLGILCDKKAVPSAELGKLCMHYHGKTMFPDPAISFHFISKL